METLLFYILASEKLFRFSQPTSTGSPLLLLLPFGKAVDFVSFWPLLLVGADRGTEINSPPATDNRTDQKVVGRKKNQKKPREINIYSI